MKPTIYFNGVKYKANGVIGYRPQLEAATKITDLALAEEVCIEKRLSMSPEELLYAVQTVLETVPTLMSTDGKVREFTNLLCWNRTASGKLTSQAGDWNDTCKANIKVQLKVKDNKTIDGDFRNTISLPTPKIDNVTYPGASSVVNVLKVGSKIVAYGRNMQFDNALSDAAWIVKSDGTLIYLTNESSGAASATFAWPSGYAPEDGTSVTFRMLSRGGVSGGDPVVNEKKVVVLRDAPTKQVVITDLVVGAEKIRAKIQNPEGVVGYHSDESLSYCAASWKLNDGEWQGCTLQKPAGEEYFEDGFYETLTLGDKVTLKLDINPEKYEFVQTPATKTYTQDW